MNPARTLALLFACLSLAGCLEVDQHPGWRHGQYAGKSDMLAPQALFHGDRLAWTAAVSDRAQYQNEYNRTGD